MSFVQISFGQKWWNPFVGGRRKFMAAEKNLNIVRKTFPYEKSRKRKETKIRHFLAAKTFQIIRFLDFHFLANPHFASIDLKRITEYNLGIVRVGHFWKCYGSEVSKS